MESNFFLVIGLGSMGKRRIRNLKALGKENIVGIDTRTDRRKEAEAKYGISTEEDFDVAVTKYNFYAFIISVPPDLHHIYMKKALELQIPAFIEASVVDTDMEFIKEESKRKGILMAPSCTLHFHPAIIKIREIVKSNVLGKISNIIYHSGQYLPDWHSYESVNEFYVSKKETGGGREIVPFELTWITLLLGIPERVVGFYKKTIDIKGAEDIDDTYNLLMDYRDFIFNLNVDVVSRYATRKMIMNGSEKQLLWDWDENELKLYEPEKGAWTSIRYETLSAQDGYNRNITEQMYIDEVDAFLKAIKKEAAFPNSLDHDHKVLNILYSVERSDKQNQIIKLA
jgi:predicted dehydrogenase